MIASSDVENQVALARNALRGIPDLAVKLDVFIGNISHKMCTQPREAADNLLSWLKNLQLGKRDPEEVRKFLLLLRQSVFIDNITNEYYESFDTFYCIKILPMLELDLYELAAANAWAEFLGIFEIACIKHEYPGRKPLGLLFLGIQKGYCGPNRSH